ncbi:MAG: mitochondrial fission ELM1 family protein [Rhizobiales bacterium]|nr:mitochondrial fission ELM1 family protein [Hyphomicrobiales bacterium]MBI3674786.1 mitochondrial fission ELM1 family protein [Hyphomicrobiales bacterium]
MTRQTRIWLLKHRRAGDLAQMRYLADLLRGVPGGDGAADWIVEEKQLVFRHPKLVRIPSLARWLLDRQRSDRLDPPWPDAIVVAEGIAAWVARDLKARSNDRTRIIVLGRPSGQIAPFDLILTTAQYNLPVARNVVRLPLPLATSPPASAEERQALQRRMAGRPRPWIVVLIGGSVPPDSLDKGSIAQIADAAGSEARQSGGSLIVLTSPRTGRRCEEDVGKLLHADLLQLWTSTTEPNCYRAALAEGDRFVVTSDSVSMTVEAINTGKPVSVFILPQQTPIAMRFSSALNRAGGLAVLFASGLLQAPADRQHLYRELVNRGVLAIYPEYPAPHDAKLLDEAGAAALSAVKALLA